MRSLDRVRNLIAGKPVDHLPAQPLIMMFAARNAAIRYIDYTRDPSLMVVAQMKLLRDFGLDCLMTCSDPAREVIDIAGDGSVDWFDDQGPVINEDRAALLDIARFKAFSIPDPGRPGRMNDRVKAIELMYREVRDEVSIVGWVEGPLALAAELRGLNHIMTDFVEEPGFVGDLLDFDANVAIAYADAQVAAGADTIAMSDAAASMMGPDLYASFLFPRQFRVLSEIKRRHPQVLTRLHMCGQTGSLIPQMRMLPADIFELDYPVDLAAARRGLGPRLVISGNVSTVTDLLTGTPDDVYEACRRCHRIAGVYHIVNSGCEVSPLTPPDNLRAMIRYAAEHGPEEVV